jgi:nicotinamide mononucleotide transporter
MMQDILQQFFATSIWEWTAFLFAIIQVFLAITNNRINFLFGFVSTIIYCQLFFTGGLFAESALNIYYAVISIIGFYTWNSSAKLKENVIGVCNKQNWFVALIIILFSFMLSYFILNKYTTSTVPIWDSAVAAFAWAGSWLLTKRKIENWIILNISNAIAIPLQYQKGYALTSLLTIVLFIMALVGWWHWKKILIEKTKV